MAQRTLLEITKIAAIAWKAGCTAKDAMRWKDDFCTLHLSDLPLMDPEIPRVRAPESPTQQRLARAFVRLREIQALRDYRKDPRFGKSIEHRIVWQELIELELQEIDEHIAACGWLRNSQELNVSRD